MNPPTGDSSSGTGDEWGGNIGSVCAILGPLVLAALFVPHGDLPTNELSFVGEAGALRYIADHPSRLVIHTSTPAGADLVPATAPPSGLHNPVITSVS
jgi:hypothetical protein